jgi:peptidoglycan/xylan/chitin deacetylase (PgdA/CDA1 family)
LRRRPDIPEAVVLTFDDGPDPAATPGILDCLAEHHAPAAFFMIGRHALQHRALAREVVARGHEVGNHTFSHGNQWFLSPRQAAEEIRAGAEAIEQATRQRPIAFRPPWGLFNVFSDVVARGVGEPSVLWSVVSEGFLLPPTVEEMVGRIVRSVRGGDIIDLHDAGGFADTPQRVLAALPDVIARLRDAGFRFVPLSTFL